jgi:hypothetical protein
MPPQTVVHFCNKAPQGSRPSIEPVPVAIGALIGVSLAGRAAAASKEIS